MVAMGKNKGHVVAVPFPAQGHMSPMLHLCKRIAADGYRVSFVNPSSIHEQMVRRWKPSPGLDIHLDQLPFSVHIPHGMDTYAALNLSWFFDELATMSASLTELLHRFSDEGAPACCVISDVFLPWTQDVANKAGIPRVVLWASGATWSVFETYAKELSERGHLPLKDSDVFDDSCTIDYLPGVTPLPASAIPTYMRITEKRWVELILERCESIWRRETPWILVNSFYELEQITFDSMVKEFGENYVPIGPLFLRDGRDGESAGPENVLLRDQSMESLEWLDQQKESSVLYISFGSIAAISKEQFEELSGALEDLQQPFLWVVRPELFTNFTPEFQTSYASFCERTKALGMVIPWGTQLQILQHPALGGFLTHCGWNSIIESIANGVPMIAWPWGAEQNTNAKLITVDWKVASKLPTRGYFELVPKSEIAKAIKAVTDDGQERAVLQENVQRLKKLARKAILDGGQSLLNLEKFLDQIGQWAS
ncbi:linamarin synthase 1 [Selaginella moellendorffii]|uniref:linamarin synthase 1 n=1 Tax=Selaginella moellendorffii TaxID=88036 RepID=UPI000D1CC5D5|nr:linamarin synthase 1 [Selaginella moellendorffii]|eukprot:XP_024516789.1 linamarin synthase 1 [Selaginella moellendorffii]